MSGCRGVEAGKGVCILSILYIYIYINSACASASACSLSPPNSYVGLRVRGLEVLDASSSLQSVGLLGL